MSSNYCMNRKNKNSSNCNNSCKFWNIKISLIMVMLIEEIKTLIAFIKTLFMSKLI